MYLLGIEHIGERSKRRVGGIGESGLYIEVVYYFETYIA